MFRVCFLGSGGSGGRGVEGLGQVGWDSVGWGHRAGRKGGRGGGEVECPNSLEKFLERVVFGVGGRGGCTLKGGRRRGGGGASLARW